MRFSDTFIVFAVLALFSLAFMAVTLAALGIGTKSTAWAEPKEAIALYAPWRETKDRLAGFDGALVSSNPSDTAWLVQLDDGADVAALRRNGAWLVIEPTSIAVTLAGCGAVVFQEGASQVHPTSSI